MKEKLPEEFDNIAEEWDHIGSDNNGEKESTINYRRDQLLELGEEKLEEEKRRLEEKLKIKERRLEEESQKKGNGDKTVTAKDNNTASEENKTEGNGKGSESDAGEEALKQEDNGNGTGEEEKISSAEEPAQSPASVN